jgi:HEAT repeat protein
MLQDDSRTILYTALHDQDSMVAFKAALTLAKQGDLAALPVLLKAIEHENQIFRRNHALKALSTIGPAGVPVLQEALINNDTGATRSLPGIAYALYQIDQDQLSLVLPVLLRLLRDDESQVRGDVIWSLGRIGTAAREAVPALLELAQDENESSHLRCEALEVAWQLEQIPEHTLPLLTRFLHDEHEDIRRFAIETLAQRGSEAGASVPALIERLEDEEETFRLRIQSAYSLAAIGRSRPDVLAALTRLLQHQDWWLRVFAARVLASMAQTAIAAIPALISRLHDPERNVVRNTLYALAQMGEQAAPAIPAITPLLDDPRLSGLAAETLAKIGPAAIPALVATLSEAEVPTRHMAAYALLKMDTPAARSAVAASEDPEFTYEPPPDDFLYPEPEIALPAAKVQAFEALYNSTIANGSGEVITYTLPYPKYEFLHYLCHQKGIMVHGSNRADIEILTPLRQSTDLTEHGDHHGIYADPDGMRPMYFAIVDRPRVWFLTNGYIDFPLANGTSKRFYEFAIDAVSLRKRPWREGMLYLLPRASFEDVGEWICREALRPLAKLPVAPADFPFLDQIMGSDHLPGMPAWFALEMPLLDIFKLDIQGFPFLDDVLLFAVRW